MCVYIYICMCLLSSICFFPVLILTYCNLDGLLNFSRVLCDSVNLISFNEKIGIIKCSVIFQRLYMLTDCFLEIITWPISRNTFALVAGAGFSFKPGAANRGNYIPHMDLMQLAVLYHHVCSVYYLYTSKVLCLISWLGDVCIMAR